MKIGNYHFELKNINYDESLSIECEHFDADLYVNGVKLAKCSNDGETFEYNIVEFYPQVTEFGHAVAAYLRSLPAMKFDWYDEELETNMGNIAQELLRKHLERKE